MKFKWLRNSRTRILLTLFVAVVLPAGALIVLNVRFLRSVERDRVVEAAIQRDLQQMLALTEKKMNRRIYALASNVQAHFPAEEPERIDEASLDAVLAKLPYAAHIFVWYLDRGTPHFVLRSQPARLEDPWFRKEHERTEQMCHNLTAGDAKELAGRFKKMAEEGHALPATFYGMYVPRGPDWKYQPVALFPVPGAAPGQVTLAGLAFDAEYIEKNLLGAVLNEQLASWCAEDKKNRELAMMVRLSKHSAPFAATTGWDGKPEVERNLEDALRGVTLGIKYRGTTLEALARRFARTSFVTLGILSLLLAGGIFLTHRNVAREVELAKLKSDFVSNVSHELRTPLSLIRLYAETLELGRLTNQAKYQEYYTIMRKESERLTALINNILDFSRIEAGRKEYDFRETDVAELVRSTLDAYRYQIEQQGFVLEEKIAGDLPPVRVDREALARSVVNLVNNALKYSPAEKFLGIKVYRANGSVRVEVSDRGIGIPRSEQHKIFQQFYRVCDPLVHDTKGTGLGLSLVRHIARAHGGEVSVESTPGKGSKFTITLPASGEAVGGANGQGQAGAVTRAGSALPGGTGSAAERG